MASSGVETEQSFKISLAAQMIRSLHSLASTLLNASQSHKQHGHLSMILSWRCWSCFEVLKAPSTGAAFSFVAVEVLGS